MSCTANKPGLDQGSKQEKNFWLSAFSLELSANNKRA